MDEGQIEEVIAKVTGAVNSYTNSLGVYSENIRPAVRIVATDLKEQVDLNVTECETYLVRSIALIYQSAEYHTLRALFHASPALIELVLAIIAVIQQVIKIIGVINDIITAVTGENIAHWIGMAWPEFEEWWNKIMNQISGFSKALGWGVDGVSHLMNAFHIGVDTWGAVWGKYQQQCKLAKFERTQEMLSSLRYGLKKWEDNPGEMIADFAERVNMDGWSETRAKFLIIDAYLDRALTNAENALEGISSAISEVAALQDNMPDIIARNIPASVWDGLERAQNLIDDAILPAITDIHDRVDEVNNLLETYRDRAEALAESLNRPGDILDRINALEEQLKQEQLEKVEGVTNALFEKANTDEYNEVATEFANLGSIIEALQNAPPPLAFMQFEMPGATPGIVAEPRETWFVGDY